MASEEEMEGALAWLNKFCADNTDKYDKEENPLRIIAYYVSSQEIQGACMSWAAAYLHKLYVMGLILWFLWNCNIFHDVF